MKISENLERKLKMRAITRDMIKIYKIDKLGYDFMGYTFDKKDSLSFHHLIVPKKDCKKILGQRTRNLEWSCLK